MRPIVLLIAALCFFLAVAPALAVSNARGAADPLVSSVQEAPLMLVSWARDAACPACAPVIQGQQPTLAPLTPETPLYIRERLFRERPVGRVLTAPFRLLRRIFGR